MSDFLNAKKSEKYVPERYRRVEPETTLEEAVEELSVTDEMIKKINSAILKMLKNNFQQETVFMIREDTENDESLCKAICRMLSREGWRHGMWKQKCDDKWVIFIRVTNPYYVGE